MEGYAGGGYKNLASGNAIQDTDTDTKIQVEESSDEDKVRIDIAGSEKIVIDATETAIGVTKINHAASTITGTATNGDITLTPNGSGSVTVSSAMTVSGNLTVNGTTTTIDSTT